MNTVPALSRRKTLPAAEPFKFDATVCELERYSE